MENKVSYLQDNMGNNSSMRLMSLLSLITAIVLSGASFYFKMTDANFVPLIFGFLISAFAPKTIQKYAENKLEETLNGQLNIENLQNLIKDKPNVEEVLNLLLNKDK